jgi:hypothetical protein
LEKVPEAAELVSSNYLLHLFVPIPSISRSCLLVVWLGFVTFMKKKKNLKKFHTKIKKPALGM